MSIAAVFTKKMFVDVGEFLTEIVKFKIPDKPQMLDVQQMQERVDFLFEEFHEIRDATHVKDFEGIVDGLIDLMYVAIGTLIMMGVPPRDAWDEVQRANMEKVSGKKPGRNMRYDAIKPIGWKPPDFSKILSGDSPGNVHEQLSLDLGDGLAGTNLGEVSVDELAENPHMWDKTDPQILESLARASHNEGITDDERKSASPEWDEMASALKKYREKGKYHRSLNDYTPDEVNLIHFMLSRQCPFTIRRAAMVMESKSADYGSIKSHRPEYFPFGDASYLTMIWTKLMRLTYLFEKKSPPSHESKLDSVIDLINYSGFYGDHLMQEEKK